MATLSDLVKTIAKVEGIDAATVGLIARYVREGGLVVTGGRGSSAAKMGPTDAASLLIGVNATRITADAAKAVKVYRNLHATEFRGKNDPRPSSSWGTLGDAIEQLIVASASGELPDPFFGQGHNLDFQEAFGRGGVAIKLTFRKSVRASAVLTMTELPGRDVVDPMASDIWVSTRHPDVSLFFQPLKARAPPRRKVERGGDRLEETTIGYRTLRAVGKLIRS